MNDNMQNNDQYVKLIEWLARLDTKIDTLMKMNEKLDETSRIADQAYQKAVQNEKSIESIRTTTRWAIGIAVPVVVSLGVAVLSIIFK